MIQVDGRSGEGGGQILRSSLALSLITQKPFHIEHIRKGRSKSGLLKQHLTCVRAATALGQATVEGDTFRSTALSFTPQGLHPGDYRFDIESAGSANLVLQAVLPAALCAPAPTTWTLLGGTHNDHAPPFPYLQRAFLPLLERAHAPIRSELVSAGFYPAGGGEMRFVIPPATLQPLSLDKPLGNTEIRATAVLSSRLPEHIAERELRTLRRRLDIDRDACTLDVVSSRGPGNVLFVEVISEQLTEVFTGFGKKGVRAETIAHRVADAVESYLATNAPVGSHLADQLLLPMAIAGEGSFLTGELTAHTRTNIETLKHFLELDVQVDALDEGHMRVELRRQGPLL